MSKEVLQEVLSYCKPDVITKSSSSNNWIHDTLYCIRTSPRFLWRWYRNHRLLYEACQYVDVSFVNLLIASGADVNERTNNGWTPLHYASWGGDAGANVEVVRALVTAGANVNQRDNTGWTALYYASWRGHMEVIRLLREAGATE